MSVGAVAVTGVGAVSAYGWGIESFWQGVMSGRTAVATFDRFDASPYRTHLAGQVPPPPADLPAHFPHWRRLSLADRFAVAAVSESTAMAGLEGPEIGVYFGSSTGGMFEGEAFYAALDRRSGGDGPSSPSLPPLSLLVSQQVSAPAEAVARHFAWTGPVATLSSACSSGTLALGMALDALRDGEIEAAVVGGADSLCRTTYGGFNSLRSVDEEPCRPFRAEREGLSIGEGGAALVLETVERAEARGANILCCLAGAAATSDSHHMTAPHPEGRGVGQALRRALADAGLDASAVAFVNAHGTGTPHNDVAEWKALEDVLGARARSVPVTSTKACVGHLLGSAGCLEAVATVLALDRGRLHPTPGDGEADAEIPIWLVVDEALELDPEGAAAASINLAFGGCNAAAIFTRPRRSALR
ncbi:MAG: beta-ketoacyl-[acyl-carrier-protein] synthase family protein [Acidobacteriota bacterium]